MKKPIKVRPLKKQFTLVIGDEEILLECTFRYLEIIERVYEMNADYVVLRVLADPTKILRHQIAEVMSLWCAPRSQFYKQSEIREMVMLAKPEEYEKYVSSMQAVVLFTTRQIDEIKFDQLIAGNDIEMDEGEGEKENENENPEEQYLVDEEDEESKKS